MAEKDVRLMKGNEVIAHAAVHCGCDGYFGYPITPQSEVMETLMELRPWETTGMVVLQAESEVASVNMVYGGAATGKKIMTSSSSPGVSIMTTGPSGKSSIAFLTGSVVVPLTSDTKESSCPVIALTRLDLPAFRIPKKPI